MLFLSKELKNEILTKKYNLEIIFYIFLDFFISLSPFVILLHLCLCSSGSEITFYIFLDFSNFFLCVCDSPPSVSLFVWFKNILPSFKVVLGLSHKTFLQSQLIP